MATARHIKPLPPLLAWVLTSSLGVAGLPPAQAFAVTAAPSAATVLPLHTVSPAEAEASSVADSAATWSAIAASVTPVATSQTSRGAKNSATARARAAKATAAPADNGATEADAGSDASTADADVDPALLSAKPIPVSDLTNSAPLSVGELVQNVADQSPAAAVVNPGDIVALAPGSAAELAVPAREAVSVQLPAEPSASQAATGEQTLTISAGPQGLVFTPDSLQLTNVGKKVQLRLIGDAADGLQLFLRDQQVVKLKTVNAHGDSELVAQKGGATELYAVANGRMYIVPVTVRGAAKKTYDLQVPAPLLSLNGVVKSPTAASAQYPGIEKAAAAAMELGEPRNTGSLAMLDDTAVPPDLLAAEQARQARETQPQMNAPSLNDSVAETAQSLLREARESERFYNAKDKIGYKSVNIQLLDERSDPAAGKIYPVSGVTVRILGTGFTSQTDAMGHMTIRDMPQKSHFLARIDDPSGAVRSSIVELSTGGATKGDGGVQRLRVMRSFTFDALAQIAQTVQQSTLGSYCANVSDRNTAGKAAPAPGIAVQIDVPAEGPYYFNAYGFLDRSLNATGPDGRFCYFNVTPGPAALTVFSDEAPVATLPISLYYNRHVEDDINLDSEVDLTTRLASMATAQEQLNGDPRTPPSYKQVDMIDLLPLGTQNPMAQLAPGSVVSATPLVTHHGRQHAYAQAAEFEPVVYTYDTKDGSPQKSVTPLIPRGFIEDMSLYAQVVHDPQLGSVMAEYSAPDGADKETVAMRLVDQEGRDAGDGWYYSDAPLTKAIFFNVPAGTYSLQVQTKDGYWLTSDTVIVYNETTSFLRLGTQLEYRR